MTKITPILHNANTNSVRKTSGRFQSKSFKLTGENALRINKMTETLDSYISTIKDSAKKTIQFHNLELNLMPILAVIAETIKLTKQDSQNDVFELSKDENKNEFKLSHKEITYPWWEKNGVCNEKQ